jgi:hypothetical protein
VVDGVEQCSVNLARALEDVLVRIKIGNFPGDVEHLVQVQHGGPEGTRVYFDFLEVAFQTSVLPEAPQNPLTTLATDWDTDHSLALAPERTAWLLGSLGFSGRANHYAGAMWFYELRCKGNRYASAAITFAGQPAFGGSVHVTLGGSMIYHPILIGDTPERLAKCFELLINAGSSAVWAQANGSTIILNARAMGSEGNTITIEAETDCETLTVTTSGSLFEGGQNGTWITDLDAVTKLNRAARDWTRSYARALLAAGIPLTTAFSMELRHGDDTLEAGMAQRYPSGPVWLNTPALQTNFGPESTAFWSEIYREMATVLAEAGGTPFLQFGEVQWWYFADSEGMPFYDRYTQTRFQAAYGHPIEIVKSQTADPAHYPQECELLPALIGEFTTSVMTHVRKAYPETRFEVLYPPDTNDTELNRAINFPRSAWTPETLACLKTENFTYTGDRNLDKARASINMPDELGFPAERRSHLIGIGDPTTPWAKEHDLSLAHGVDSVVLFALDQFCLIGYPLPFAGGDRRSSYMGD